MKKRRTDSKKLVLHHTQAKLDLYEKYLEKYLAILGVSTGISKINIYDIFCGTGIYEDGKVGSPIVAFNCISRNRVFIEETGRRTKPVALIVNDGLPKNVEKVRQYLNTKNKGICHIDFFELDANDMFEKVIEAIGKQSRQERNLVFIDPYGYKEISKDDILALLNTRKTEIILFLPISFMYRFKKVALKDFDNPSYKKLRDFIHDFFDTAHPIRRLENINVGEFVKYIKDALSYSNEFYSASYYIQRDRANYYGLFFVTNNLLGLERFLDAKWDLDVAEGSGFVLPKRQMDMFNESEISQRKSKREIELESLLLDFLAFSAKSNKELYEFVLINEFRPKHANEILRKLQSEEIIVVEDFSTKKPARKGAFYLDFDNFKKTNPRVIIELKEKKNGKITY